MRSKIVEIVDLLYKEGYHTHGVCFGIRNYSMITVDCYGYKVLVITNLAKLDRPIVERSKIMYLDDVEYKTLTSAMLFILNRPEFII